LREWYRLPILTTYLLAELKSLVTRQFEKITELERAVAKRRDEIARLKGGSGQPNIKPKRHGEGD